MEKDYKSYNKPYQKSYNKPYNKPYQKSFSKTPKEPFVKLDGKVFTKSDLEAMSIYQLTDIINQIPIAISQCKSAAELAKKQPGGKHKADSILFAKKQLQNSLCWIHAIRKKKSIQYNRSVTECFREAAYTLLDKETFDKILSRATAMAELNAGGEE